MAEIAKQPQKTKPKRIASCFPSCFGFAGRVLDPDDMRPAQTNGGSGGRIRKRWLSWSRFRMKKPNATKTVPVDAPPLRDEAPDVKDIGVVMDSNKIASKRQIPPKMDRKPSRRPTVLVNEPDHQSLFEEKYRTAKKTIVQTRKELDTAGQARADTCQKQPTRKSESRKSGETAGQARADTCQKQPTRKSESRKSGEGSPENQPKTKHSQHATLNSHSRSPPHNRPQIIQAAASTTRSRSAEKRPSSEKAAVAGKFDAVAGMSILMVTLAIMLFWGKLCAILVTSAWLYSIPRLRTAVKPDMVAGEGDNSNSIDFNSEEYKKKVILEGLLERNHRSGVGLL
ncbi:PREDICTED: uncharacterized protein LOC104592433 isoform X1 [Nelumbo nucifera]|uniref:Uncharacterized protein LOC104592433 isoform X1 n=1 Tax=Nelumbo nucifera TaxID=4432 RepID=A0A1U7ZNE0_NELNU|nr:PREDICTED: uncharacterized protein LOC104592433 isoform X1 [Nelumbo nucifera]